MTNEQDVALEGTIESLGFSEEKHRGPYSNSKEIPIALIGIRTKEGKLETASLPIDISTDPFSQRRLQNELLEQQVFYQHGYKPKSKSGNPMHGDFWNFRVKTGDFTGLQYNLEEFIDW